MILVFSGTGNSEAVAQMLAKGLNDKILSVFDVLASENSIELSEDEMLGFVFPVYSWGPPAPILHLIHSVKLSQKPSYLYFVCTCGDDAGKTAEVFSRAVKLRGWRCDAGFSVTMPNTYICLPGFDVDAPAVVQCKLAHAAIRVMDLVERIQERKRTVDCHEGAFPFLKTYVIRPFFNRFLMSSKPFHVTDACVSCGKCIQVCQSKNIHWKNGRPIWGENCMMCLACYHHCPKHAIEYGKQTKGKGQYTYPL